MLSISTLVFENSYAVVMCGFVINEQTVKQDH